MIYLVIVDLWLGVGCWDRGGRVSARRQSAKSWKGSGKHGAKHDDSCRAVELEPRPRVSRRSGKAEQDFQPRPPQLRHHAIGDNQ